jgi:DNA-binding transcriptional LysR family regulator
MSDSISHLTKLSLDRLNSFCQIAEAGSVVAASRKTGISQGQYSRQIRDLEQALETKLFEKEGRFLMLSQDGVRLASITRAYFAGLAELAGKGAAPKPLRLGAGESIIRWILVPRYAEILEAAGGTLDIKNHRTADVIELLKNGDIDLGIVRSDAVTDELEQFPFLTLQYVLVVPRRILPDKSSSGIQNVSELPFVLIDGDGRFVNGVSRLLVANNLPVKVAARVESFSLAIEVAKVMSAATIVPQQAAREFPADSFASVSIAGIEKLDRSLSLVVSKERAKISTRAGRARQKLSRIFQSNGYSNF